MIRRPRELPSTASSPAARAWLALGALILGLASALPAQAAELPLDPNQFANAAQLLSTSFVASASGMIGGFADHRPYDPATLPKEGGGLDLSAEVTLVKVTDSFRSALQSAGLSSASSIPDSVPLPRILIRKALGKRVGLGLSGIQYKQYQVYGGDMKLVVSEPDEGPAWALRLSYAGSRMGFIQTSTWTPQLLISKPLAFAEPYLGAGAQLISGTVDVPQLKPLLGRSSQSANVTQLFSFLGIQFKTSIPGLLLVLEGSYNQGGTSTLGTRIGLTL